MTTTASLQQYLHDHIPLSKAMQISILSIEETSVQLSAPLAPNINHQDTVFGGSASAVAILAAWSLLYTRLESEKIHTRLVIQRNTMNYLLPIHNDFTARSFLHEPADWNRFIDILQRRGKSRITVSAELLYNGQTVGTFTGDFVALGYNKDPR